MKPALKAGWQATRWFGAGVWSFVVWTAWLALVTILCVQLWWFRSSELAVPGFLLRAFEERLAASDLHASFGRTVFDPTGRVLLEDFKLSTPAFREPIATARMIYVRLNPWSLVLGAFEPEEIQLSGVSLYEPAMLSASGRAEPIVRDLEATLALRPREIEIRQLRTRLGGIGVAVTGLVPLPAWQERRDARLPIADYLARDYPRLSHQIATRLREFDRLEGAELRLALTPSDAQGLIVEAGLLARGLRLEQPIALTAREVQLSARFPFGNAAFAKVQLEAEAAEVRLDRETVLEGPRGRIRGSLNLTPGQWGYAADEVEVSVRSVASALLPRPLGNTHAVSTSLTPTVRGRVATELAGTALAAELEIDPARRSGRASLRTRVQPEFLPVVSEGFGRDLAPWITLRRPAAIAADLHFDPEWRLAEATGAFDATDLTVRGVNVQAARGRVAFGRGTLTATDVVLQTGASEARGSYAMDTATRDFRFLLAGRLEPSAIDPWFRDWWPRLFSNFDFSAALPAADVEVAGRWGLPALTTVFISVAADSPRIRTVPLDHVRTVLFVRPHYTQARELQVRHRGGTATGTFARWLDPVSRQPQRLDFQVESAGIDPREVAGILGETGRQIVAPFRFAVPPSLQVAGRLDSEAATPGVRPSIQVTGSTPGAVDVFEFPVSNARFTAEVKDDTITVQPEVDFAGGRGSGQVWLEGRGEQRRLRFDYALKGAKLGPAAEAVEEFTARRTGASRAEKSTYLVQAADVNLDLAAAAEGPAGNPYGLKGRGQAVLEGARLGEVPLFGPLSELIPALSLRFTQMQSAFELDGPLLRLPDARLTGANSGAAVRGVYHLQTGALDFNARVTPFSEGQGPLQLLADLFTRPLASLLEVHLTGTLRKPAWSVVLGSRDPLRAAPGAPTEPAAAPPPAEPPPAPAE